MLNEKGTYIMDKTLVSREMTHEEIISLNEKSKKEMTELEATMSPESKQMANNLVELAMKAILRK